MVEVEVVSVSYLREVLAKLQERQARDAETTARLRAEFNLAKKHFKMQEARDVEYTAMAQGRIQALERLIDEATVGVAEYDVAH